MKMITWGLVAVFLLMAGTVPAQQWEVFDMNTAGFPSNTVKCFAQGPDGSMWVGTDWGLCHQIPGGWEVLQLGNSGLPENDIRALAMDTSGMLWIGTTLNGVVRYDGTDWENFNMQNSPLPDDEVQCITIDHRGWAWIGTVGGLACYTGTEWRVYTDQPSSYGGLVLNGVNIRDVAVRPDGLVAIGTMNGGFHYLTDTLVSLHATFVDQFPDNTALGVLMDTLNDERWLACPAGGLLRHGGSWLGGPWFQYTTFNSPIPNEALTSLAMDATGLLWIGSQLAGLMVRSPNGTYGHYTMQNSGLPDNTVNALKVDDAGSIWVGTYFGGAARFDPSAGIESVGPDQVSIGLFPNPSHGLVSMDTRNVKGMVHWNLADASGRVVESGSVPGGGLVAMDWAHHRPGAYLLHAQGAFGSAASRLLLLP